MSTGLIYNITLKLQDQITGPLSSAIASAKRQMESLATTASRGDKNKLLEGLQSEADALGKQLEEAKRKLEALSQSTQGGAADLERYEQEAAAAREAIEALNRELEAKQKALRDTGDALDAAGTQMDNTQTKTEALNQALARKSGWEAFNRNADALSSKAKQIGKDMEAIGLRMGGLGAAGQMGLRQVGLDMGTLVSGAVSAEKALYGIASTAGLSGDVARDTVRTWSRAVNQIAMETNQQQDRVVSALGAMVAKGLSPDAALSMLRPIGRAATAAQASVDA